MAQQPEVALDPDAEIVSTLERRSGVVVAVIGAASALLEAVDVLRGRPGLGVITAARAGFFVAAALLLWVGPRIRTGVAATWILSFVAGGTIVTSTVIGWTAGDPINLAIVFGVVFYVATDLPLGVGPQTALALVALAATTWHAWDLDRSSPFLANEIIGTGAVLGLSIGVAYQMTRQRAARRDAAAAVAESEARFRSLAETTPVMIWLSGEDGAVDYGNGAWSDFTGATGPLSHDDGAALVHPEDVGRITESLRGFGTRGRKVEVEFRLRRRDGSWRWMLMTQVPRAMPDGRIIGYVCSGVDITERRAAEQETRAARDAALAATAAKSTFLAMMSHELRTPLTGILGMAELADDCTMDTEARTHLDTIRSCGNVLLGIINDILDFSKIEAGKLVLERAPFALRRCVIDALRPFEPGCAERGVELVHDIAGDVPDAVVGDALRLRQVLLNLVGNAVKFTERGSVRTVVRCAARSGTHVTLDIAVADTGIGMAAEQVAHIFEPFVQADGSTARRFGGTGLGLTICRQIVELMGGHLTADSVPGQGSTFRCTLPFALGPAAPAQPAASDRPHPPAARLRVLVAEDNLVNQRLIAQMLARRGHEVTVVGNGQEAVRAVHDAPAFDLVLMDVQMPEMDGFAATRAIRAAEADTSRHLPIAALTANAVEGDRELCLAAGMDAYLAKPIDSAALDRLLATIEPSRPAVAPEASTPQG